MKDFRQITFETLFEEGLTSLKEKILIYLH